MVAGVVGVVGVVVGGGGHGIQVRESFIVELLLLGLF